MRGAAGRAAGLQLHPLHGVRRPRHPPRQAPPRHHRRRRALRQVVPPQPPPRGTYISYKSSTQTVLTIDDHTSTNTTISSRATCTG